ncbi:MAG: hypothetical protein KUG76_02515 [Gammaproteobacteria bacterium]|nr:hypothetical protein [Gammaproteobacteria bacterium]
MLSLKTPRQFYSVLVMVCVLLSACGGKHKATEPSAEQEAPSRSITQISAQEVHEGAVLKVPVSDSSASSSTTYVAVTLPDFARLEAYDNGMAEVIVKPSFQGEGTYPIELIAKDESSERQIVFDLNVVNVNRPPIIEEINGLSFFEGRRHSINIKTTDPDEDRVSISAENLPAFATIHNHGDGTFTLLVESNYESAGIYPVRILADDGRAGVELKFDLHIMNQEVLSFTAGAYHSCAATRAKGVFCWGANTHKQAQIPEGVSAPNIIGGGGHHTCALDDGLVKCWYRNVFGQAEVPVLLNPVELVAGAEHSCALDDSGVHCWGWNNEGQSDVPTLDNPTAVSAGDFHTCAMNNTEVTCWGAGTGDGFPHFGQINRPSLNHPVAVSVGAYHSCAIDSDGVKCWGAGGDLAVDSFPNYGQSVVPDGLQNPIAIATGERHTCVIDDNGITCWGSGSAGNQVNVPNLKDPKEIVAGAFHTCALGSSGLACWGNNDFGQNDVPPIN